MGILRKRSGQNEYVASTAEEIYDMCYLDEYEGAKIIIPAGTYSFLSTTPTKELILGGNRTIVFDGKVTIEEATLMTKTAKDSTWYSTYSTSRITWDSGNSRFYRTAGNTWTTEGVTTDWWMGARDCWYRCSSLNLTSDYFYPEETCYVNGLSSAYYILCEPIYGLKVEGHLNLDITNSGVANPFIDLIGFAGCDLSDWHITMHEPRVLTSSDTYALTRIRCCMHTHMPSIDIRHAVFNKSGLSATVIAMRISNTQECTLKDIRIANCRGYNNASYGFQVLELEYCDKVRLIDCYLAGNTLEDASAGIIHYNLYNSWHCLARGHSIAPYSELGSETHYNTSGGGVHTDETIKVAA